MINCAFATLTAPAILPNTAGETYLRMFTDNSQYILTSQFTSSDPANCPLASLSIEPIDGGTSADYTSSDSNRVVSLVTDHTDSTQIVVSIPYLNEIELDFVFRIKATLASGVVVAYTDNITIRNTDCCFSTITPPAIQTPPSGLDHIPFLSPGVYTIPQFTVNPSICNNAGLTLSIQGMDASTLLSADSLAPDLQANIVSGAQLQTTYNFHFKIDRATC